MIDQDTSILFLPIDAKKRLFSIQKTHQNEEIIFLLWKSQKITNVIGGIQHRCNAYYHTLRDLPDCHILKMVEY